ncbi:MAG: response regulator [Lachnospiraceae bacterium]|nr:response regulator [Lachnospiraceae bacterium]
MYNLLIVDDEPLILESLYQMISKKRDRQFMVFKAGSALESLKIFREHRIDLLMTDICLPETNGLKLRDKIQENWPECFTIFLTGQEEFEYAKEAVDAHTVSFVLKVEGDEAILAAIDKGYKKIEAYYNEKSRVVRLNQQLNSALPLVKSGCVRKIVHGEITSKNVDAITNALAFGSTQFDFKEKFLIVVCWVNGSSDQRLFIENIIDILEESLRGAFRTISSVTDENCIILAQSEENDADRLRGFLEIGLNICDKSYGIIPDVYVYGEKIGLEAADKAYMLLNCRHLEIDGETHAVTMYMPNNQFSGILWRKTDSGYHVAELAENQMSESLAAGNEEAYIKAYGELKENCGQLSVLEEHALFCTLSSQLLNAIANFLPQDNQSFDEIDAQKLSNFRIYADFSKAIKEIYEMAHVYFQARRSLHMDSRSRIVHVVNSYIKENLSKDLSMVVLGDYVGLNPAYLSRIYKETAGQSINSYISDQRTVLAKKLLKDPTIKIQKIAEMTGMRTASYFTHYFKKYVGISPQEYRNQ